ncbi:MULTISPECIES: chromate efflux transporter [unclassified Sphingobium]|uniref:chromate efflux transporter n=1 Tax=unclassified Sphingobium TaxID=2611147 RepID=UPI001199059F|nr:MULTISPECIES: chromate efflux transporter [unclassified Sphingobium]MBG6119826.1 chromate transporter [Sphingobium sp. JAI105]TWC96283.1 chromate transporter [Sphingobium sp. AEW010]TWD16118.1 chromate transporter [Sphingobium sp. AEW013]TWD19272.1 chromate transporter [Sphingobium sp. AEW001]
MTATGSMLANPSGPKASDHGIPLGEATRIWARIAALSFGGPAGQIAVMHRILVEEKRWIGEERFLHALNYCMLLPGPEAQQLAIYIGWLLHKTRGGLIAGALFVLPGFLAILALSYLYVLLGQLPLIEGIFFGLKAAVLAVVVQAVVRVGSRALKNNVMRGIAVAAFVAIFFLDAPFPLIVLAAGVGGYIGGRSGLPQFKGGGGHGPAGGDIVHDRDTALGEALPDHARPNLGWSVRICAILSFLWLAPVAGLFLILGPDHVFTHIATFFSQMAVVTFGGAYAVLAYVAQEAVGTFGWLRPGEMLDGLGMAETTPGPLIMVTQFVGFLAAFRDAGTMAPLLAATLGAILTTWVTFVPCFLWIFAGAPFIERLRGNKALSAALTAITAAVVGVIFNLAIWFAIHTLFGQTMAVRSPTGSFDVPVPASINVAAVVLALAAAVAIFRFKLGVLPVLAGCATLGAIYTLTF